MTKDCFKLVFTQTVKLGLRRPQDVLPGITFFVMIHTMFYLLFGIDEQQFRTFLPGLTWLAALLASMMMGQSFFVEDCRSGHLQQWVLADQCLSCFLLAYLSAHYLLFFIPIMCFATVMGGLFDFTYQTLLVLALGLSLGLWILTLLGALIRLITLNLPRTPLIYPVLSLPLFVPILTLGAGAVLATVHGQPASPHLALLLAYALVVTVGVPWMMSAVLKYAVAC